ncbi:MAG: hypothetical protein ACFFER_18005, partial [Candidatus Thorarchaeota archaeon]
IDLGIGDVEGEVFVAVNAKLFLAESDGRSIHTSPEFRHEPHMTMVMEARAGEGVPNVRVMLNSPEVETRAQAREAGRLVDLERMLAILRFSRGVLGSAMQEAESDA